MSIAVACKSIFENQLLNKKSTIVAFLIDRSNISVVIHVDCKLSKQNAIFDLEKWCIFFNETKFNNIFDNIHSSHKPVILSKNFSY